MSTVTDAMQKFVDGWVASIPTAVWSGTYANKSGYHNTVDNNFASFAPNYSIQLSLDLNFGLRDKARACDITMSDSWMRTVTSRLVAAVNHPNDNRLNCLRSFIGTTDSKKVTCYIKDDELGNTWRFDGSRDSSHLWHVHVSVLTKFCATWSADLKHPGLEAVLSVITGESWEQWLVRKGGGVNVLLVKDHDSDNGQVWYCDGQFRRKVKTEWWGNGSGPITNVQVHQAGLLGNLVTGPPGNGQVGQWDSTGTIFVSGGDMDVWGINIETLQGSGGTVTGPVDVTAGSVGEIAERVADTLGDRLAS